jgi:hypothetical protein
MDSLLLRKIPGRWPVTKKEEVVCRHYEVFSDRTHSRCKRCGQRKHYKLMNHPPEITQRGKNHGKLTMIKPPPLEEVPA